MPHLRPFLCATWIMAASLSSPVTHAHATTYEEYPSIRMRSLDKITARTLTFDAQVGTTIKFGDIYIKIQSCRKPPPVEKSEAAAFLQIWQNDKKTKEARWVYSGWMFASSPALSAMDHPVYDVWVIDCIGKDPEAEPPPPAPTPTDGALPDEGTVPEGAAPTPSVAPEQQKPAPASTTDDDIPVDSEGAAEDDAPPAPNPTQQAEPQQQQQQGHDDDGPPPAPKAEPIDGIY